MILSKARTYVSQHRSQLTGFLVAGSIAAGVNIALIWLLVDRAGMSSPLQKNLANIVSMEAALLFQFVVSRSVVWRDRERRSGWRLLRQIGVFHAVVGIGVLFRVVLFAGLEFVGLHYIFNTVLGIGSGAVVNFLGYNHVVFIHGQK